MCGGSCVKQLSVQNIYLLNMRPYEHKCLRALAIRGMMRKVQSEMTPASAGERRYK